MATISGEVRDENGDLLADCVVRAYRRDTGALLVSGLSGDGTEEQPGDDDFASVALLLHCDGTNGSTTFTDSSGTPKTVTAHGNAAISTAQSKFGGSSGYFDGTGDYLSLSSTGFTLAADFTIELWVYLNSATTYVPIIECRSAASFSNYILGLYPNKLDFVTSSGRVTGSNTVGLSGWHHLAVTRSGSTIRLFIDGVAESGTATWSGSIAPVSATLTIGKNVDGNYFNGYIDDLRITVGVARYTASFTPPSAQFEDQVYAPERPLGAYTLTTTYTGEVQVIALDPDVGTEFNDLILRTTPV